VNTFGDRLRQLRREAGLSQADLAGDDLSASYVSLLESAKRVPSPEVVQQLAARLGCSSMQLWEGRASERDQRLELEIAYSRLAVEHGESVDARERLGRLLAEDGVPKKFRDEATLLLAMALQRLGDGAGAVRRLLPLFERSLKRDTHLSALDTSLILCRCYLESGDMNRAARAGEDALDAARAQGLGGASDYFRLAATVMMAHMGLGDYLHARTWAAEMIEEAEAASQVAGQAALYWNSALLAEVEGRLDEALRLCEHAMARLGEQDNLRDYARVRGAMAQLLLRLDEPDLERTESLLNTCLPDLTDHGSRTDLGMWNYLFSTVLLLRGDSSAAEGRARQALDLLRSATPDACVEAWIALTDALMAQGRRAEAQGSLDEALRHADAVDASREAALLWRAVAERLTAFEDHQRAVYAFRKALDAVSVRDRSKAARVAAADAHQRLTPQVQPTA
jgi:tetratricopeptide (TPR) repeat protein